MLEEAAPVPRSRRLARWAGWALLAGLAAYVALAPGVLPSEEVLGRLVRWDLAPVALLALALVALNVALRGARWVVLAAGHAPASATTLVAGYAWCTLLFQVVPLRGGDALKVAWMKLRGGSAVRSIVAVVVERILDSACLALILALAVLFDPRVAALLGPAGRALLGALVAFCVAALLAAGFGAAPLHRWLAARAARGHLWRGAAEAADAVVLLGEPARFAQCALLSLLAWGALVACYTVWLRASVDAPLAAGPGVLIATTLVTFLGITPGSVGLYEAAGVLALTAHGVAADTALASIALLHLLLFAGQALIGAGAWLYLGSGAGSLRSR